MTEQARTACLRVLFLSRPPPLLKEIQPPHVLSVFPVCLSHVYMFHVLFWIIYTATTMPNAMSLGEGGDCMRACCAKVSHAHMLVKNAPLPEVRGKFFTAPVQTAFSRNSAPNEAWVCQQAPPRTTQGGRRESGKRTNSSRGWYRATPRRRPITVFLFSIHRSKRPQPKRPNQVHAKTSDLFILSSISLSPKEPKRRHSKV